MLLNILTRKDLTNLNRVLKKFRKTGQGGDQPVRAYKFVTNALGSPIRTSSVIVYLPGSSIRPEFGSDSSNIQCGAGINVAPLSWCVNIGKGPRFVALDFTVSQIAVIPDRTDGKFRLNLARVAYVATKSGRRSRNQGKLL